MTAPGDAGPDVRFFGVTVGVVSNNSDPDGLGRVKLTLPWLADDFETDWARVAAPMAGAARGFYSLPEVDDEVLVGFQHGRPDLPFVLGALWNGKDKPPEDNGDGKNDRRSLTSRSGHVIRLTDTAGEEKVEIVDKSGANSLVIDTAKNTVTISADTDVVVTAAKGKLTLSGEQGVEIAAKSGDVKITAGKNLNVEATAKLVLKGVTVDIN